MKHGEAISLTEPTKMGVFYVLNDDVLPGIKLAAEYQKGFKPTTVLQTLRQIYCAYCKAVMGVAVGILSEYHADAILFQLNPADIFTC